MGKLKKILSVCLICLVAVISSLTFFSGGASKSDAATTYWNDYATTAPTTRSNGVYEISTPEQLAYFNKNLNNYINSHIILTANLDMKAHQWYPNQQHAFAGLFDGQYYSISNLLIYGTKENENLGLFGKINYGQVQNLNVLNCTIYNYKGGTTFCGVGTICGYLEGSYDKEYNLKHINIYNSNIYTNSTMNNQYTGWSGGAVGFSYQSIITNVNVIRSYIGYSFTETYSGYFGGIVGEANNTKILQCMAIKTSVNGGACGFETDPSVVWAGGIAGALNYKKSKDGSSLIQKCGVEGGSVKAGKILCTHSYAGGVVGRIYDGKVDACYNTGYVNAKSRSVSTTTTKPNLTNRELWYTQVFWSEQVWKNGKYTMENKSRWDENWVNCFCSKYSVNDTFYVQPVYDESGITITKSTDNSYCGGIAGYNVGTITNCYNSGKIGWSYEPVASDTYEYIPTYNNTIKLNAKFTIKTYEDNGASFTASHTYEFEVTYYTRSNVGQLCGYSSSWSNVGGDTYGECSTYKFGYAPSTQYQDYAGRYNPKKMDDTTFKLDYYGYYPSVGTEIFKYSNQPSCSAYEVGLFYGPQVTQDWWCVGENEIAIGIIPNQMISNYIRESYYFYQETINYTAPRSHSGGSVASGTFFKDSDGVLRIPDLYWDQNYTTPTTN